MNEKCIKIPIDEYNIIEQTIYKIIQIINKNNIFKNIHPNTITIFRFVLVVIAVYFYYYNKTITLGIIVIFCYLLNIFLDYLDGYVARCYNKSTILGDILDHVFDWILFFLLYYIIDNKDIFNNILIIINLILLGGYFGSHQKKYNNSNDINEILDLTKRLVFFNDKFYSYFSDVTFYLHLIILFIYKNLLI
jgi:phosphatidylglycerophosphate synthase